jgi:hypothetical protein
MENADLLPMVRSAVYDAIVRTGQAPDAMGIASAIGVTVKEAQEAMLALADAHVIVLEADTSRIRFAAPFSNVETGFRVTADGRSWFAPCAWDAFGIPAALHRDAEIAGYDCGVRNGRAHGSGVVHLLVPAARFWDDIVYT